MGLDRHRDPVVVAEQYGSDRNLAARQSIYAYATAGGPHFGWVLDFAALRGGEAVLDVGCGNGLYVEELAQREHGGLVVGLDRSAGMLGVVGAAARVQSNAEQLPFADGTFDVVLAAHMLYHVPDRAAAIAEMRRVLRAGGVALAVTNSEQHLHEFYELLGAPGVSWNAENGAIDLERSFDHVTRHDRPGRLEITAMAPLAAYVDSMMLRFDKAAGMARVAEAMEREGHLRIRTAISCFVCR